MVLTSLDQKHSYARDFRKPSGDDTPSGATTLPSRTVSEKRLMHIEDRVLTRTR